MIDKRAISPSPQPDTHEQWFKLSYVPKMEALHAELIAENNPPEEIESVMTEIQDTLAEGILDLFLEVMFNEYLIQNPNVSFSDDEKDEIDGKHSQEINVLVGEAKGVDLLRAIEARFGKIIVERAKEIIESILDELLNPPQPPNQPSSKAA